MSSTWDELRERVRRAEHDEKQLEFLREQAGKLEVQLEERARVLKEEGRDVEELEEVSLEGLFLRWLGVRERSLERERREELAARLRCEQTKGELARVAERVRKLEQGAAERRRVEQEYAAANERRRAERVALGGAAARRLTELGARLEEHGRRRFELGEARAVCAEVRTELAGIMDALNEAWAYGAADLVAVGRQVNFRAELGKRHFLDRAHEHRTRAADALRRLGRELADTGLRVELDLALPAGAAVADHWFDGLITDWITQGRLSRARERTQQVVVAVDAVGMRLQQAESALEAEVERDRRLLEERLEG